MSKLVPNRYDQRYKIVGRFEARHLCDGKVVAMS